MSVLVLCKFTPLGFETNWSDDGNAADAACKFTPLGFETIQNATTNPILSRTCKFTPLGFET